MMRAERKETPAMEKKESPKMERREKKMGIEVKNNGAPKGARQSQQKQ